MSNTPKLKPGKTDPWVPFELDGVRYLTVPGVSCSGCSFEGPAGCTALCTGRPACSSLTRSDHQSVIFVRAPGQPEPTPFAHLSESEMIAAIERPGPVIHIPAPQGARANDVQVAGTHYKEMGIEPWDVIDTWPLEQRIGAYRAGALKYTMRMGSKDARLQEIQKGGHYQAKLAEVLAEPGACDATNMALLQQILGCYSPDDTIMDYQDKIRALLTGEA